MRILAAIVFFLVAAFGVLIGVIYPWAASSQSGEVLGTWRVFEATRGFAEIETPVPRGGKFVLARLDIGASQPLDARDGVVLTMTVTSDDWTISAQDFTLEKAVRQQGGSPQDPALSYTVESDPIYLTAGEEPYRFTFGHGALETPLAFVDMTLIGGVYEFDEAVPPIGWGLMAVGILGVGFTLRKRRDTEPPAPKWGRG